MASCRPFGTSCLSPLRASLIYIDLSIRPAEALLYVQYLPRFCALVNFAVQHITSSDPLAAPKIDPKFLSRDYGGYIIYTAREAKTLMIWSVIDLQALMHVIRFTQKIAKTGPLASQVSGGFVPPPDIETDEQLAAFENLALLLATYSYIVILL